MAYTGVNKSTNFFNTLLYSGNGSTNSITGVNFQPDWTWIKTRNLSGYNHNVYDAVRGVTKLLKPSGTNAEITSATSLTAFDSDGFSFGGTGTGEINQSNGTYASWNWKANGQGSSNTDGSINTTYTSVNNTAGFSISSYTGTGANATIGTGLTSKPACVIIKNLTDGGTEWMIGHQGLATNAFSSNKYIHFNTATTSTNSSSWNSTEPTSNGIVSLGNGSYLNGSGKNYICYAFTETPGFSKFSDYIGNANADGPFLYCGFKPAFIILKNTVDGAKNWEMLDNKRPSTGQNPADDLLFPDTVDAESTSQTDRLVDFVSNGIKIRGNSAQMNGNGQKFIFMAFAAAPIVGTNDIPANAR